MGFLSKLFGKAPAKPSGGGGRISVYAVVMQAGGTITTKRCEIDGRTFPCPNPPPSILTLDTAGWALDVGGYCPGCRGYRCEQHARFGEGAKLVCGQCGTALTGGP